VTSFLQEATLPFSPFFPIMMRIAAAALASLAVAATAEADVMDETCALQVREGKSTKKDDDTAGSCAVCNSCGGDFPADGGRMTYFQSPLETHWRGYGEECSGQNRDRTGDRSVIFSPKLCCKGSKTTTGPPTGACALCGSCDAMPFSFDAGEISYMPNSSAGQNFEAYLGACLGSRGSENVNYPSSTPSSKLCCKQNAANRVSGMCVLCAGACSEHGGRFPNDGGLAPYAAKNGHIQQVKFTGYSTGCSGKFQEWSANGLNFLPKVCCS